MNLEFPSGLPGFETYTRFVLEHRAEIAPIMVLQSLDSADLCFLAAPVNAIDPAYELAMTAEDQAVLGSTGEILCLAILSAAKDGPLTANLLAPVVIDARTGRAVQAVRCDSRYSHQHPLERQCL
jgi:flagellar assembly factor FliW